MRTRGPFDPQRYSADAAEVMSLIMKLRAAGITDRRVLGAMEAVPRRLFVDEKYSHLAYGDHALPIDCAQTISSPHVVALMSEAAQLSESSRVLEIGTGSGYQTAILSELARHVVTIERHRDLYVMARLRLKELRLTNVVFVHGDGSAGAPAHAPFDCIMVTAAATVAPQALLSQLKEGGRMVIPLGAENATQRLSVLTNTGDEPTTRHIADVRFVPLIIG